MTYMLNCDMFFLKDESTRLQLQDYKECNIIWDVKESCTSHTNIRFFYDEFDLDIAFLYQEVSD